MAGAAFLAGAACLAIFLAPETYAFSSAPARKRGAEVFFTLTTAPVRGLRAVRAARSTFSKAPKPVRTTFSPRATARVMVSMMASTASWAALRLPSGSESRSMSSVLFTGFPSGEPGRTERSPGQD